VLVLPAPIAPGREVVQTWAGGIGASADFRWETFPQYLDALRAQKPSVNVVQFVGHGALRLAAIGPDNRPVTTEDLRAMERMLAEALDAGAFGYSTGLVYPPSAYSVTEELVALARSMARRGGLYFSHVRGESAMVEDSIREAIRTGIQAAYGSPEGRPSSQFRPHVSAAYANAPADPHPVRVALDAVRVPQAEVTLTHATLIEMHRDNRMYQWRTIATAPLGHI
jgi:hypothetical protein